MSKTIQPAAARRFDVFVVEDYTRDGEEKANWVRIGVAFENKDGKGFNVTLARCRSAASWCCAFTSRAPTPENARV